MSNSSVLKRGIVAFALVAVAALVMAAAFAPVISPHDPNEISLAHKFAPPSSEHLLGCDHLGRDVLSRLLHGTRVSMGAVAAIVTVIMVLGFAVGATAGFCGGTVDSALMRICDVFMTFPTFILAMFMVGVLGTGLVNVVIAVSLTHWAWYARIIRSLVLTIRNREYLLAARVCGTSRFMVVVRHIIPPVMAQLAILATLDLGHMMMHVSGLSFLGLGVAPPTPEWGVMIADARQYVWTHPELIMYPGLMIFVMVMAFNILGDSLRDAFDPHAEEAHGTEAPAAALATQEVH